MRPLLALALAAMTAPFARAAPRYAAMNPDQRGDLIARHATRTLAERLLRLTAPFVGTPYVVSPLGEEAGRDPDPRLRYDAVDCLTFIETAMALAAAERDDQVLPLLDRIRYRRGEVDFAARNHVVESQWLPENVAGGWLRDIARELAGDAVQVVEKPFDERSFSRIRPAELPLPPEQLPHGRFRLDVIPLETAESLADRIPSGTLLFIVRGDDATHVSMVTHVGLFFRTASGPVLRHAANRPFLRVVDEPFSHFIRRNRAYDKRPVRGFAAFEVRVPPPSRDRR